MKSKERVQSMRILRQIIWILIIIMVSLGIGYYYGSQSQQQSGNSKISQLETDEKKEDTKALKADVEVTTEAKSIPKEEPEVELEIIEAEIHRLVNDERELQGVKKLTINTQLVKASRKRSEEIVTDFSHERQGVSSFSIFKEPDYEYIYQAVGENIVMATYQGSPEEMGAYFFKLWKESPGHYKNMISPNFTEVGTGIYKQDGILYGTQLFGTPRN